MVPAYILGTVVRKAARAWRTESTWFVSKTPAVRQSPATNKGVLLGKRAYILSPLAKKKKKKGGGWGGLKSPKLGRTPLRPARIHCASACFRNRLIVLWPIPVWLKGEWEKKGGKNKKVKGKKLYKENKRVVFFVRSCHWATGRLNRERTQAERMCSNFPIKEHWKRPHAEWLADARELDSLIKCDVVGRLPAFTKHHLSSDRSLIVQGRLIKNCNSGSFLFCVCVCVFFFPPTIAALKAGKGHKLPVERHYQSSKIFQSSPNKQIIGLQGQMGNGKLVTASCSFPAYPPFDWQHAMCPWNPVYACY